MFFCLSVLLLCVFSDLYSVFTEVTVVKAPSGLQVSIVADAHSSKKLSLPLQRCAEEQVATLKALLSDHRWFAELPYDTNNNTLGLIKKDKKKECTNLEIRGIDLVALELLDNKRRLVEQKPKLRAPKPRDLPEKTVGDVLDDPYDKRFNSLRELYSKRKPYSEKTVGNVLDHYDKTFNSLRDLYLRSESQLKCISEQTFSDIIRHQQSFCIALEKYKISPEDPLIKLYDIEEPLGTINNLHDTWRKIFDLHTLHTVHTHVQKNESSALVCVGTRHAASLCEWLPQLEGYTCGFSRRNSFSWNDDSTLEGAALTEIDIKKAAGLLSPGLSGTVLGHAQRYGTYVLRVFT